MRCCFRSLCSSYSMYSTDGYLYRILWFRDMYFTDPYIRGYGYTWGTDSCEGYDSGRGVGYLQRGMGRWRSVHPQKGVWGGSLEGGRSLSGGIFFCVPYCLGK